MSFLMQNVIINVSRFSSYICKEIRVTILAARIYTLYIIFYNTNTRTAEIMALVYFLNPYVEKLPCIHLHVQALH